MSTYIDAMVLILLNFSAFSCIFMYKSNDNEPLDMFMFCGNRINMLIGKHYYVTISDESPFDQVRFNDSKSCSMEMKKQGGESIYFNVEMANLTKSKGLLVVLTYQNDNGFIIFGKREYNWKSEVNKQESIMVTQEVIQIKVLWSSADQKNFKMVLRFRVSTANQPLWMVVIISIGAFFVFSIIVGVVIFVCVRLNMSAPPPRRGGRSAGQSSMYPSAFSSTGLYTGRPTEPHRFVLPPFYCEDPPKYEDITPNRSRVDQNLIINRFDQPRSRSRNRSSNEPSTLQSQAVDQLTNMADSRRRGTIDGDGRQSITSTDIGVMVNLSQMPIGTDVHDNIPTVADNESDGRYQGPSTQIDVGQSGEKQLDGARTVESDQSHDQLCGPQEANTLECLVSIDDHVEQVQSTNIHAQDKDDVTAVNQTQQITENQETDADQHLDQDLLADLLPNDQPLPSDHGYRVRRSVDNARRRSTLTEGSAVTESSDTTETGSTRV